MADRKKLPRAVIVAITVFLLDSKWHVFCEKRNQLDTKGTAGLGEGRFPRSLWKR
jgi:hypothetical protein